jgi:hypothetical protein
MDIPIRPTKRRNIRKHCPLLKDDLEAADVVTVEHVKFATWQGTVVKAVLAPVDPLRAETMITGDRVGDRVLPVQEGPTADYHNVDIEMDEEIPIPRQNMVCAVLTFDSNNITSGNLQGRSTAYWGPNWNERLDRQTHVQSATSPRAAGGIVKIAYFMLNMYEKITCGKTPTSD